MLWEIVSKALLQMRRTTLAAFLSSGEILVLLLKALSLVCWLPCHIFVQSIHNHLVLYAWKWLSRAVCCIIFQRVKISLIILLFSRFPLLDLEHRADTCFPTVFSPVTMTLQKQWPCHWCQPAPSGLVGVCWSFWFSDDFKWIVFWDLSTRCNTWLT